MSIIKTEHLTHIYSQGTPYERAALRDFNIEIEEGEFAGIIGHLSLIHISEPTRPY